MPYFFLSHADDDDEIFVERFYIDLSSEVRSRTDVVRSEDVGFLDIPPADGTPLWPIDTWQALAGCRTFVALCSGRYFLSDRCGRIWGVFTDRLRRHELETGVRVPALIPVVWSSEGLPPDAFNEDGIDLTSQRTPGEEDLRVLLRLRSRRTEYRAVVASLARRVVEVAQTHRLPPAQDGTDLDTAANAFEIHPRWVAAAERPRKVHFAVAAGTRTQMRTVRRDVRFYGDRQEDWAPFAGRPLAAHACSVAARRLLAADVISLDRLAERLLSARRSNEIVVLLVDAWATRLDQVRSTLADLLKLDDAGFAVIVTASGEDPETAGHHEELSAAVAATFADRSRRDAVINLDVTNADSFDDDLGRVLAEAQRRLYHSGRVFRRAAKVPGRSRPILGGPQG